MPIAEILKVACVIMYAAAACPGQSAGSGAAGAGEPAPASAADDVSPVLAEAIGRHDLPGMVAVVLDGDRVVATGAAGVRKRGGRDPVALTDSFHIGSCTKAMTATLCAMLVDEGKLRWDATLADSFPDAKSLHPDYRDVTLAQLLLHRSGAPGELEGPLWNSLWGPTGVRSRRKVLDVVFTRPPATPPATRYLYSNFGYAVAGHMAEKAARKPWEELMREKLFVPLGMTSAGFGAPADRGDARAPRGHTAAGRPVEPSSRGSDNPPAIGPGGTVHCSVTDWAKFVGLHLRGARGDARLLKAGTFVTLHTPPEGNPYAMGWLVAPSPLGEGVALNHAGSNTMWYAVTWVVPANNRAVLVACNQGGPGAPADKACDEVSAALIRRPETK